MEKIRVQTGDLKVKAGKVDDLASEYLGKYTELYQLVEGLTSSAWTGPDADKFRTQIREFEDDFRRMKELMNEYARYLRQAADNYDQTSENIQNEIASLPTGN